MAELAEIRALVDAPTIRVNGAGNVVAIGAKPPTASERAWVTSLMAEFEAWRDLVGMESAVSIELEYQLVPSAVRARSEARGLGFPRIDALVRHSDGGVSIVEGKIKASPAEVMGGVGQLLYYKTAIETFEGVEVKALLLAAPLLPPLVLDSIAGVQAPIRFLKATDKQYAGLVPTYG